MEARFAAFSCPIVDNPVTTDGIGKGGCCRHVRFRPEAVTRLSDRNLRQRCVWRNSLRRLGATMGQPKKTRLSAVAPGLPINM